LKILLIKTELDIVNEKLPTLEYVGNLPFHVRAAWIKENNNQSTQLTRLLSIFLVKLAYYAPSTAQNFWKLCPNYARFSKLCSAHQNYPTSFSGKIKTEQGEYRQKKEYHRWEPSFSTFLIILALFSIKVAQNSNISMKCLDSSAHFSTRHHVITRGVARLKFSKIKTNMAARGLLRKTLFPPSLVSCLRYQLFLPSKQSFFRQFQRKNILLTVVLYWKVNENCDVDVTIDHAGYHSKTTAGKYNYSLGFLCSFFLASLPFGFL